MQAGVVSMCLLASTAAQLEGAALSGDRSVALQEWMIPWFYGSSVISYQALRKLSKRRFATAWD